jgi:hypothetical protein
MCEATSASPLEDELVEQEEEHYPSRNVQDQSISSGIYDGSSEFCTGVLKSSSEIVKADGSVRKEAFSL